MLFFTLISILAAPRKFGRKKSTPKGTLQIFPAVYPYSCTKSYKLILSRTKLPGIHPERYTFDCQFLYSVLVLSVLLHGKPSFS